MRTYYHRAGHWFVKEGDKEIYLGWFAFIWQQFKKLKWRSNADLRKYSRTYVGWLIIFNFYYPTDNPNINRVIFMGTALPLDALQDSIFISNLDVAMREIYDSLTPFLINCGQI